MKVEMKELRKGQHFIGPDGAEYVVTAPAADHEHGFVFVWNLSMSDQEVLTRLNTPGFVEPNADGTPGHPRAGFFAFSVPVFVELVTT
jgi:hypothetical protein